MSDSIQPFDEILTAEDDVPEISLEVLVDQLHCYLHGLDLLPPWTCLMLKDERTVIVQPMVETAKLDLEEDGLVGPSHPEHGPHGYSCYFLEINERGNTTLYYYSGETNEWSEIWAVV